MVMMMKMGYAGGGDEMRQEIYKKTKYKGDEG